ncbi:MAG TPA: hypothetical protein VGC09_14665 [Rhodopila sp.]
MNPFHPDPGWYEKHWYSHEPVKPAWRRPAAFASVVASLLALLWLS